MVVTMGSVETLTGSHPNIVCMAQPRGGGGGGGGGEGGVLPCISYIGTFRPTRYHVQGPLSYAGHTISPFCILKGYPRRSTSLLPPQPHNPRWFRVPSLRCVKRKLTYDLITRAWKATSLKSGSFFFFSWGQNLQALIGRGTISVT